MQIINEFYYDDCVRHPNVKIGKHIGISPMTKKKVTPKCSTVNGPLLRCNHTPSIESYSVLTKENRKVALESKESLLIMRDQSSLNRNIISAPLYLLGRI